MTTKFLILIAFTAAGTFVGLYINKCYGERALYYRELCGFVQKLLNELPFRKESVSAITREYEMHSKRLSKQLEEYRAGIAPTVKTGYSLAERNELTAFFKRLGTGDLQSELGALSSYAQTFEKKSQLCESDRTKKGALAIKLGFLGGLCIGVLAL